VSKERLSYPWDRWFKQLHPTVPLVLLKGQHFKCKPEHMAIQFRNKAAYLKRKVTILIEGNMLLVLKSVRDTAVKAAEGRK
jgi:hypothetical protein